jgi:hypothetical protein
MNEQTHAPAPEGAPNAKEPAKEAAPADGGNPPQGPGLLESIAKCVAEVATARSAAAGQTAISQTVTAVVFLGVTITLAAAAPSVAVPLIALLLLGGIALRRP